MHSVRPGVHRVPITLCPLLRPVCVGEFFPVGPDKGSLGIYIVPPKPELVSLRQADQEFHDRTVRYRGQVAPQGLAGRPGVLPLLTSRLDPELIGEELKFLGSHLVEV